MEQQIVNWIPFLTIVAANIAMFMGMLGTAIALYFHSDRKIDEMRKEMKDFHGRLCGIPGIKEYTQGNEE